MSIPFIKMHGAGNDYVFVDAFQTPAPAAPSDFARKVSCRHYGIGSDGLVVLSPPETDAADVHMKMWNADGSEGSMCGNAARCVALWMNLRDRNQPVCRIQTASRLVTAKTLSVSRENRRGEFEVDLGEPEFAQSGSNDQSIILSNGETIDFISVSMGNPHAVVFVDEITDRHVLQLGPLIEEHEQFDDGTNVEWVRIASSSAIDVRVWERGSGETLACGSGACAAAVASAICGHTDRTKPIQVRLPGGTLAVNWAADGPVLLTGPAEVSFVGEFQEVGPKS